MPDPLLHWRNEFPVLDNTVYLISHSLGAMPRRTRERLNEYADVWSTRSIRAWEEAWWEMPITVGDLIAKIIGAGYGEGTGLPSVHYSSRAWVAVAGQGLLATATTAVLWNWGLKWVPVADQC